jgi:hypothetical protein
MEITPERREELHRDALQLSRNVLPPGWELVQSSGFTRVAFLPAEGLYYKEFLPRSPLERVKALARGSRAVRARRNNARLLQHGFDAPLDVAWGALPGGREYLVMRAVPGQPVTAWLGGEGPDGGDAPLIARRLLLRSLGSFIGRLHAAGFIHGDLRPGNVFAAVEDGSFHFALIDNERTVRRQPPPGRALLRNLMQLNMLSLEELPATDRMRFFRAWRSRMTELSSLEAKILGAEAYRWAMRRLDAQREP